MVDSAVEGEMAGKSGCCFCFTVPVGVAKWYLYFAAVFPSPPPSTKDPVCFKILQSTYSPSQAPRKSHPLILPRSLNWWSRLSRPCAKSPGVPSSVALSCAGPWRGCPGCASGCKGSYVPSCRANGLWSCWWRRNRSGPCGKVRGWDGMGKVGMEFFEICWMFSCVWRFGKDELWHVWGPDLHDPTKKGIGM